MPKSAALSFSAGAVISIGRVMLAASDRWHDRHIMFQGIHQFPVPLSSSSILPPPSNCANSRAPWSQLHRSELNVLCCSRAEAARRDNWFSALCSQIIISQLRATCFPLGRTYRSMLLSGHLASDDEHFACTPSAFNICSLWDKRRWKAALEFNENIYVKNIKKKTSDKKSMWMRAV